MDPFVTECAQLYRKTLLDQVVPFWMKHALGSRDGAINNCLDDDGNILSTDRYLWSQGRALWTFSALYNRMEPRPEWLDVARGLARYLYAHGRDERGRWMFRLDESGAVIDRDTSLYVDGFVMNGLTEYFRATGDSKAADLALETFRNVQSRLASPGSYGIAPYVLPEGHKTLGVPMVFSFFYHNLGKVLGDATATAAARRLADELLRDFYNPHADAVTEFVRTDGRPSDLPEARVTVPGHVIEAMWFLIEIFEDHGDSDLIRRCCELIRRHIELGWDHEFGGIRLALDISGARDVAWQKGDCKPWWVHVEALIATAFAYLHTQESWCLDWHRKVRDFAYSHYPTPAGEWTQWLDRRGDKGETAALPVKDPFHLPRALIYLIDLFEEKIPQQIFRA